MGEGPDIVTRPRLGWSAGRLLVPSAWQNRDPEWRHPLITLDQPGQVGPLARMGWSLDVQWPQPVVLEWCDLTAFGYQIFAGENIVATAWMAAAGVLVMDLPGDARAELRSDDHPVDRRPEVQELEMAESSACLLSRKEGARLRLVLATRAMDRDSLQALARQHLDDAPAEPWAESIQPFDTFWAEQSPSSEAAAFTLARAVDDLASALRPPSGVLSFGWMLGRTEEGEGQLTDDLYAQVRAWSMIHPPMACALVKTVLSAQKEDGAIPRIVRPDGFHDTQWAALPLLARSAWVAWQAEPNREFHDYVMPRLHRYLTWAVSYFDPEWRGLPVWRDAREAWIPETHNPLVASVDLPSMLASELDALHDLARAVPAGPSEQEAFHRYRASLGRTLSGFFWNKAATMFQDRFPAGDHVIRLTLGATLPLLDTTLPRDSLQPVAERLDYGGALRDPAGVREWSAWPDEPTPPPVREDHQLLVLDALLGAGERTVANRLRNDLATRHAAGPAQRLESSEAALRVVTLGKPVQPARPFAMISPILTWMDRHRMMVLGSTLVFMLLVLAGILATFMLKRSLTVQSAETTLGLARRLYQEENFDAARRLLTEVVESGRSFPGVYLNLGNSEFRLGDYEAAEMAYRHEIRQDPNAVNASMNLALTLLYQQRTREAIPLYQDVTNRFRLAAPQLAQQAALALRLLQEQPPRLTLLNEEGKKE